MPPLYYYEVSDVYPIKGVGNPDTLLYVVYREMLYIAIEAKHFIRLKSVPFGNITFWNVAQSMLPLDNKTWEQIRKNYFKKNKFITKALICERIFCEEKIFARVCEVGYLLLVLGCTKLYGCSPHSQ